MRKLVAISLFVLFALLAGLPAHAQSLSAVVLPSGCGSGSFPTGIPYLTVDSTGKLCVSGTGGGGGGTSSNFGSAFPTSGTAAGFTDGTNMVAGKVRTPGSGGTTTDPAIVVVDPNVLAAVNSPIPTGTNTIGAVTGPSAVALATSANQVTGSAYGNAANFVKGTTAAMTGTTSTQLIAAVTSNKIYLTHVICTNSHATVGTFVALQDGSGGTIIYEGYAAAVGGGFSVTLPTPVSNTSGNGIFVADVTTGANVICSGSGFSGS